MNHSFKFRIIILKIEWVSSAAFLIHTPKKQLLLRYAAALPYWLAFDALACKASQLATRRSTTLLYE